MKYKIGDEITIHAYLSTDGKWKCRINSIEKGYIHANPIHDDGSLCCLEVVIPVNSQDIL
ncbi:MAG: hypothetical protein NC548_52470 [Lachnospiraceae bacterium]|nr:hypothetical protein [Lachnospiraceae bacterium]